MLKEQKKIKSLSLEQLVSLCCVDFQLGKWMAVSMLEGSPRLIPVCVCLCVCLRACVALEIGWDAPAVKGVYLGMEPVNRFPHFQPPPTEYCALALATEVAFFQWDAGVINQDGCSVSIHRKDPRD